MKRSAWPKAVVFDLDGTLVDSAGDLRIALNAVLEPRGLRPHSLEEVRHMLGGGVRVLLQRACRAQGHDLGEAESDELAEQFLAHYGPRATENTRFFEGAAELIEDLHGKGIKLGICTNKPTDITLEKFLHGLGVLDRFGAVVGMSDAHPRKPDPAMLREVLRQLAVEPAEAVMIGDSIADVATARAAGVPVLVVGFGYTPKPPAELGADGVIGSFAGAWDKVLALVHGEAIPQT